MSSRRQVSIGLLLAHCLAACGFLISPATGILALATLHGILLAGTLTPGLPLFGKVITRITPTPNPPACVYLTIDDGPDPVDTPALLDLLDLHNATATFFLIGSKARLYPDLTRNILQRGHSIGNHSDTHPAASFWILSPSRIAREIDHANNSLTHICGQPPQFFRPPVGHHNPYLFALLAERNLPMVTWNRRGFDTKGGNPTQIADRITKNIHKGDIILLHEATPIAVELTEIILTRLSSRGLQCRALPQSGLR